MSIPIRDNSNYKGSIHIIIGPMFSGKCFGKDTPIRMFDGKVKMSQNIFVGDLLMGDDSTSRKVLSTTMGFDDLYRIDQINGNSYTVNSDHILSLKSTNGIILTDISVKDYLKQSQEFRYTNKGYKNSVNYKGQSISKSPYHMGRICCRNGNKLPNNYKYNSRSIRLNVLAGIIDECGFYDKSLGGYIVKLPSIEFVGDICDLSRSLGFHISTEANNIVLIGGNIPCLVKGKNSYGATIDNLSEKTHRSWRINGKIQKTLITKPIHKPNQLTDILLTQIGSGYYYGFVIDKNHRFLLSDYTVVHNTSELIRLKTRAEIGGKKCLVIKYCKDNRHDETKLSTHDLIKAEAIPSIGNSLKNTIDKVLDLKQYNSIYVDEIQFYTDGSEICDQLANAGYDVVVSGLQGDFERKPFGCVPFIIPLAEKITHLTAVDPKTGNDAPFTARYTKEKELELIGATDKYLSVDRSHYYELNNEKL